ncbi:hypothetical protein MMC11_003894 [Xylographa trunciseda]|nr:hypothetical protein [Xylographa trunciseda]
MDSTVLDWYQGLENRILDLVGDYAGNERFLLEDGFQLLHAVYTVEYFLEALIRRACNFHVVFFSDNQDLCIPPQNFAMKDLYLLARSIIIRHLVCHLPGTHPDIEVHCFNSVHDSAFTSYLETSAIYFVMCHDGAYATAESKTESPITGAYDGSWQRIALRKTIQHFIGIGFNVALVNGLEVKDTKVMAMIVEGRRGNIIQSKHQDLMPMSGNGTNGSLDTKMSSLQLEESVSALLDSLPLESPDNPSSESPSNGSFTVHTVLTERLSLVVASLSNLLNKEPESSSIASAFLLHAILLTHMPISARRLKDIKLADDAETKKYRRFLADFALVARTAIDSSRWKQYYERRANQCDLVDLMDGRVFKMVLLMLQGRSDISTLLSEEIREDFSYTADIVRRNSGVQLDVSDLTRITGKVLSPPKEQKVALSILRFSNAVFDQHLVSIKIDVDVRDFADTDARSIRIFREISHWHNPKRAIDKKKTIQIGNDKAGMRLRRSNQRYMDEMAKYAASLTNAAGKLLEPQTITVQKETKVSTSKPQKGSPSLTNLQKPQSTNIPNNKKAGPKGKTTVNKTKELAKANILAKKDVYAESTFASWANRRAAFDKIVDPEARYRRTKMYQDDLPKSKLTTVDAEITLYSLLPLLEIWSGYCKVDKKYEGFKIAALIWSQIRRLWNMDNGLTKEILTHSLEVCHVLGVPPNNEVPIAAIDHSLTFGFKIPQPLAVSLSISLSPTDFQLLHCGPYMDRNMDSQPDTRVPFNPDGWQRRVLDELDADHSVFVVAPTSAGKTFISFYAMEKVLRADDDGVLVYVAPTKALVNQIAAEIQARFSKIYKYGGKSVWAIHTRDYRVNNPTGCQILVTVPHILQIMLLAPSNAKSWAPRVRCIIFDEIHSIGQAEDGVVWEQLLLLAPCPIIALSATVGNPGQFNDWLTVTQRSSGFEMSMIQHEQRYSDLRKFIYSPPARFTFKGLEKRPNLGGLGLDGIPGFQNFHPVASLVNKSRGIPADLGLEPRDCLILWQTMAKHQTITYPVSGDLDPKSSLPQIIRKADIVAWERRLKDLLSFWMSHSDSPFDKVLNELGAPLDQHHMIEVPVLATDQVSEATDVINPSDLQETILPLVTDLHEHNALPAIFFNYDRAACERIGKALLDHLQNAETSWKAESTKWAATMESYEKWKTTSMAKAPKAVKAKKTKDKDDERGSKADAERDSAEREASPFEQFDPNAPCEEFSFADVQKVQKSDMEEYFRQLEWKGVAEWLMKALKRGVGIHHAGMNKKYRTIVEILFRKGYLRVVIATGTLALGINMPCKTVIFSGDSVYLTALNFRQCAGRAGRRGFDILGNVVFHGVPIDKACRLLSSRLPDLNGHFPITTTLILRLFTLLHDSKNSAYAERAINALLSQPRLYLGGESFKAQVLHHLRFSIEYLRRQQLLGPRGEPINFTSCVSHLYFTENSSFAFHALLKGGYFHQLCANIEEKPSATLRQLMLVMAHLFGRRACRQADFENKETIIKRSSSIVFLPELPTKARRILQEHNQETLETFTTYVRTFAKQHCKNDDRTLPLTGLLVGGSKSLDSDILHSLPATTARSHFVALSGHSDTFTSISDLCSSTRSGIFLEKAVIPHLDIPSDTPLNAYLYDFFMHGNIQPLEIANGIRRGDVWFLLNDFSLVLATITTSLENFLNVAPMDDGDMMNVMGLGDALEEEDDGAEDSERPLNRPSAITATTVPQIARKKKEKVLDSWDAFEDDEEVDSVADTLFEGDDASSSGGTATDEGLANVLLAFRMLKVEFDTKFKAMWA